MEPKILSSKVVYNGRIVNLRIDTVREPGDKESTREIVEHADCVAMVAVDQEGSVLLERQFREPAGKELLEIPAGGIEPGEDPVSAVKREMREETGFLPRRIESLGGFYSAPGYSTEYLYLYLVSDLKPERLHAEDTDLIRLEKVPAGRIPAMIASGEIRDAKSIAGLLMYLARQARA